MQQRARSVASPRRPGAVSAQAQQPFFGSGPRPFLAPAVPPLQRQAGAEASGKPPVPGEHPEIARIPSAPLRDLYRQLQLAPAAPRLYRYVVEAGVLEVLAQERAAAGADTGGPAMLPAPAPTITPEGSIPGFHILLSDARGVALDLVTSREVLREAFQALPADVADRFLELLAAHLTGLAVVLAGRSRRFREAVREALRRRREGEQRRQERRREQVPPQREGGARGV